MEKSRLRFGCFFLVVVLLVSLSFTPLSRAQEPIKIGWAGPVTGSLALLGRYSWEEDQDYQGGLRG
jgi:hypothetical protein